MILNQNVVQLNNQGNNDFSMKNHPRRMMSFEDQKICSYGEIVYFQAYI